MFLSKRLLLVLFVVPLLSCRQSSHELTGYVEGEFTYLSSSRPGILKWLGVKRGETVTQSQRLFILENEPEQSESIAAAKRTESLISQEKDLSAPARSTQLGVIEGQLQEAKAQSALNAKRLARSRQLYAARTIAKDALDAANADYQRSLALVDSFNAQLADAKLGGRENAVAASRANVTIAKAQQRQAEWALGQKTVLAPGGGMIIDTFYRVGEYVPAGYPILALLRPENLHVVFYLSPNRISQIKLGSMISVRCAGCHQAERAAIEYVSPNAEYTPPIIFSLENHSKLVFRVHAKLFNPEHFHPGQPATIELPNGTYS